jgi:hypothetical protein
MAVFPGMEKVDARYRFPQVVPFAGHPCAQIHMTAEVQGPAPGTHVPMTMNLSGDMYRALDLKRPLAEEDTGPVTVEGQEEQKGVTVHVSGKGTLRLKETHRWLQVNGKLVNSKG